MKRAFYIGISLAVLCLFARTAQGQYRIDSWTTENGLPQNTISGLVQTRDGYIWLGTSDGLVRFDGVRFTVFNKANSANFPNNRLSFLEQDRSGRLWCVTEDGVVFYYQNGAFTIVKPQNDSYFGMSGGVVDDGAGSMLVWSNKLRRAYQYRGGVLVPFELPGIPVQAAPLGPDRDGALWFSLQYQLFQYRDGQVRTFTIPGPAPTALTDVWVDRTGSIWMARDFEDKSVYRYRHGRLSEVRLPLNRIWSVTEDRFGNIWFGSYNGGIARLDASKVDVDDPQLEDFQYFRADSGSNSLPSNQCLIVIGDREGGVWTATEKGLARFTPQVVRLFSRLDGMAEDNVYPILEDRAGAIWLGAWQTSLMKFSDGKFSTELRQDSSPFYSSLYEDPSGGIWFGNLQGLFQFENGKAIDRTAELGLPSPVLVSVVMTDNAGRRWAGTNFGLSRFENGRARVFNVKDGLPEDFVDALLQTRDGRLWIGTRGGVAVADPAAASPDFTRYTESEGLAGNNTRSFYEDADGVVWIGSYEGGITRVKDGRLSRITMNDGLFSNGVFCFLEDKHGWIWMNSNQGIFRARRQELNDFADGKIKSVTSIAYGRQDGLVSVEGNGGRQPAGIKARDGRLWFPMARGIAMVDPDAVITNPMPPPVLIESVSIDRHAVANDIFQAAIHDPNQTIVMAPGQVNLEIQYTGLSLIASNEVKFKYKLEGLDSDWTDAGRRRTAYFSFIPPGTYTFRVIAANRDGVWNETGAVIKIVVKPHFYRTWWFFTLLALGFVGIAVAVYRYRVTQLKREREQQFAFTRQLIAKQEDERKRIAGELHDSLGQRLIIIKNLALMHLALDTKKDGNIKDLSDETSAAIAEVKEISYNLRPYQLDRIGMTKAIEGLVSKISGASPIEFFVDVAPIDDFFDKDAEINFYRIVQESLNNMVKYSAATRASITVEREGDRLELTIRDDGKGFDAAALMRADSKARGFGLIGIVERAQFLGSTPVIQSAPGQGTMIKLIVDRKAATSPDRPTETA